jgi:hypothetical protein
VEDFTGINIANPGNGADPPYILFPLMVSLSNQHFPNHITEPCFRDTKYELTNKNSPPILRPVKSNYL